MLFLIGKYDLDKLMYVKDIVYKKAKNDSCYGPNICVPSKFICKILMTSDSIPMWGFWKVIK